MKKKLSPYKAAFRATHLALAIALYLPTRLVAQSFPATDTITEYAAKATYYADKFVGRKTSNGEIFSQDKYTAAHHSIKMGTLVMVTNPQNGRQVIVRINDRCPRRGIIDLTRKAIRTIGIKGAGSVTIRILPASYHYAWEHQDELIALEGGRQVLVPERTITQNDNQKEPPSEPTDKPAETKHTNNTQNQHTRKSTSPIEQTQANPTKKQSPTTQPTQNVTNPNAKYDILLDTGVPRSMAEHYINKLPIHLKENAQLKPERTSGKLTLILSLSTSHKKATATQNKLKKSFPNCQVIQSN